MSDLYCNSKEKAIDAIIFDLGKVIVEVDHEKTYRALEKITNASQSKIKEIFKQEDYFLYELGNMSDDQFFLKILYFLTSNYGDTSSIAKAWDEMIVGISKETIVLLEKLKKTFPLFALSNTNSRHVSVINKHLLNNHNIKDIRELFNKVYYSHELNLGKPNKNSPDFSSNFS